MGKYRMQPEEELIEFSPPFRLVVSSPVKRFLEELAENLLHNPEIELIGQKVLIEKIEVQPPPALDRDLLIRMLSPMTMYSTLKTTEGKSKTYYYSPFEKEFSPLMERNARKKYELINRTSADNLYLKIIPEKVNKNCEKIMKYKGTVIKGWKGTYRLQGSTQLIQIAYECGLGAKNSQGFGCFEVVKNSNCL